MAANVVTVDVRFTLWCPLCKSTKLNGTICETHGDVSGLLLTKTTHTFRKGV